MKVLMPVLAALGIFTTVLVVQWPGLAHDKNPKPDALLQMAKERNPHDPDAKHPARVAKIMKLLPKIPADASFRQIIAMLGLPKSWDGGSVSTTHCTMVWRIAAGYKFALNFDPVWKGRAVRLVFTEASISAQRKPGFPPDEYHTVYPYRSWKGMVQR
jgi:hypothetical protein